jgi:DNA-binding response OmpR family regulator
MTPSHGTGAGSKVRAMEPVAASTMERKVLVVDDNEDAADSLATLLGVMRYEVRVAYDGPEAIEAADQFEPAVALLDIGLPQLSGYDIARHIRRTRGDDVLLVAITGWGQEEDRRKAREAGFDHHFTKPADFEVLLELIEQEMKHRTPHD